MELVDEVRDLPLTVSAVLAQVISECDNADASVSSLARIMAGDQALAAMVLKLANSAYYGYARKIESLPDAVVLLGFASVKNLAITASITRLLASDRDEYASIRSGLFDHSLATAVGARILGRTQARLGREGVRRRPAARPRPDRARLLRARPLFGELTRAAERSEPAVRGRRARDLRLRARRARLAGRRRVEVPAGPLRGAPLPPRSRTAPWSIRPSPARSTAPTGSRTAWASASSRPALPEWPEEESRAEFQIDQHSIGVAGVGDPRRVPRGLVAQGRLAGRSHRPAGGTLATVTRCASSSSTRAATRDRTTMVSAPRSPRVGTTSGSRPAGSATALPPAPGVDVQRAVLPPRRPAAGLAAPRGPRLRACRRPDRAAAADPLGRRRARHVAAARPGRPDLLAAGADADAHAARPHGAQRGGQGRGRRTGADACRLRAVRPDRRALACRRDSAGTTRHGRSRRSRASRTPR